MLQEKKQSTEPFSINWPFFSFLCYEFLKKQEINRFLLSLLYIVTTLYSSPMDCIRSTLHRCTDIAPVPVIILFCSYSTEAISASCLLLWIRGASQGGAIGHEIVCAVPALVGGITTHEDAMDRSRDLYFPFGSVRVNSFIAELIGGLSKAVKVL